MSPPIPPVDHPYLTTQFIPYIGNKRALLPFLSSIFRRIQEGGSACGKRGSFSPAKPLRFVDPFAGTGAVSRLARFLGWQVTAGDWEFFSWVVNHVYLTLSSRQGEGLFSDAPGGLAGILAELNALHPQKNPREALFGPEDPRAFISRFYAPRSTAEGDPARERLFYSAENALFLDRVRQTLEERYPGWDLPAPLLKKKALLTASLILEGGVHANTSGVFKAYHKGFGGHGRDALKRILGPMHLERPHLIDGAAGCRMERGPAEETVSLSSWDFCYLDPPYNGHQYGSNYHLLNTLALWDRPEAALDRDSRGVLVRKAGIRRDWVETRSDFCSPRRAGGALSCLLGKIDAPLVALSYNTEGVLSFEELYDLLESQGRVEIFFQPYVQYRGGRQSPGRKARNSEMVLLLRRREVPHPTDRRHKDFLLQREALRRLAGGIYHPQRLSAALREMPPSLSFLRSLGGTTPWADLKLDPKPLEEALACHEAEADPSDETLAERKEGTARLEEALCTDHREVLSVLLDRGNHLALLPRGFAADILKVLRKLAFVKYRDEFFQFYRKVDALFSRGEESPARAQRKKKLADLRDLARRRGL